MQAMTFADARPRIPDGSDSPRAMLEREGQVRAFVHFDGAGARAVAEEATRRYRAGRPRSLIDGMPVGLQVMGFAHRERALSGTAQFLIDVAAVR